MVWDFNADFGSHEIFGKLLLHAACDEFRLAIKASNLLYVDSIGDVFTWARNGVHGFLASKLDRVFC